MCVAKWILSPVSAVVNMTSISPVAQALQPTSLAERAYSAIRELIVSLELAPGAVIDERELMERLEIGRTPVREALRRLAALGLVSFVPNRGVRVRTISRDELHEAFMVRAELESLATEVAATKITPEELDELDQVEQSFSKISQELRSREPGEERRSIMGDWVRGNHAFHDIIYRVAGLPLVEQMAKSARRTFSGPAVWAPGDHSLDGLYLRNAEQHRAIKQALAAGSGAGARALAREHVLSSFTLLETILEQVGAQPRDWQRGRATRR
jgi:DNA-binding GntR family transcriptional regulator